MIDVNDFLKNELGMDDAAVAAVAPHMTLVAPKLESAVLRQADYSRQSNELKAKQDAVDQANDRLNRDIADWGQLTAAEKRNADGLRLQIEQSQAEVVAAHNALRKVATETGYDVNKAFEELKVKPVVTNPNPNANPPAPDLTGYAKVGDVHAASMLALTIPTELMQIAHEHQQLTGQTLDTRKIAHELITRANTKGNQKSLDPRVVWEELEGVPAKREAKQTEKYNADIAAAEERGRIAGQTAAAVPTGGTPAGSHAIVFTHPGAKTDQVNRAQRPSGARTGVSAAAEALASGKYRTDTRFKQPA